VASPEPAADASISTAIATARTTWPGIVLADEEFRAYLASRVDTGDATVAAENLCLGDLWLACAVVHGDPVALRVFETEHMRDVDGSIAHLGGGSALAADVRAAVRERVLGAAAGGRAKLAEYRGRGDLRGWLRVVAVREGLQVMRSRRRETALDDSSGVLASRVDAAPPDATDDERRIYRDAFAAALATLTPRERNLLRQQYLYNASVDELAALYGVHRATVARWIARVRDQLLRRTRRHVGDALRLAGADLDSVMGRIANHLDVSLRQTLSHEPPEP
jgi:RNA polymerase sigma-70 factor, ECF subfamily